MPPSFVIGDETTTEVNGITYVNGPMIVHCSAGVGRTGTIITLDTQLKRIEAEGDIDIFSFVRSMRVNRCCMVQTEVSIVHPVEKYVYVALLSSHFNVSVVYTLLAPVCVHP